MKTIKGEMEMKKEIIKHCREIEEMLLEKNKSYGNSALEPIRIFSKATTMEQINVRIDDKLSRIAKGNNYDNEDTELDLIGYLILKRIRTNLTKKKCESKREEDGLGELEEVLNGGYFQ